MNISDWKYPVVFWLTLPIARIYYRFSQERFIAFLKGADQNPLLKAFLRKFKSRNINLSPFWFTDEFFWERKTAMFALLPLKNIAISNREIKKFLNKKMGSGVLLRTFAHELGHFNRSWPETEKLREERKGICNIERDCLYVELSADEEGFKSLKKIAGKEAAEKHLVKMINSRFSQCKKCRNFLAKNASKCPKIKELKEMGVFTERESGNFSLNMEYFS